MISGIILFFPCLNQCFLSVHHVKIFKIFGCQAPQSEKRGTQQSKGRRGRLPGCKRLWVVLYIGTNTELSPTHTGDKPTIFSLISDYNLTCIDNHLWYTGASSKYGRKKIGWILVTSGVLYHPGRVSIV